MMTRQPPASGLVLRAEPFRAYSVIDPATGQRLGHVVHLGVVAPVRYRWAVYTPELHFLAEGRTRSDALHAAWPDLWPTRPAQPPNSVGGQSGEGDRPDGPQNDAQTGVA